MTTEDDNQSGTEAKPASAEVLDESTASATLDAFKLQFAARIASGRWRRCLRGISQAVERGQPLEDAITQADRGCPRELRCLMREALGLPDPAEVILRAVQVRQRLGDSWRSFVGLITYPMILLIFATLIALGFSVMLQQMVVVSGFAEFDLPNYERAEALLDDYHASIVGLCIVVAWSLVLLGMLRWLGPPWAWNVVIGGIRVIGRPLRWLSLQEILLRYELFASQGSGGYDLAGRVARSFAGGSHALVSQRVADQVEAGAALGQALGYSMLSDGLCRPALLLLDRQNAQLGPALGRTAAMLRRLAEQRCRVLGSILPVFVLLMVGTLVVGAINAYLMIFRVLVSMVSSLA